MKRKPIKKSVREEVYKKCNGHCAYCGCELEYKDMQCDHIFSVYRAHGMCDDINNIDNLLPSCRACNFYKNTLTIEQFRRDMKTLMERVKKPFIYRLAMKYGMVEEREWDGKFYFEKLNDIKNNNNEQF